MRSSARAGTKILLVLAVLLLVLPSPLSAEEKYCDLCGKRIRGSFYTVRDKHKNLTFYFCENCRRTAPRCAKCGMPIRPPKDWDKRQPLYCGNCYDDLEICYICGHVLKRGEQFYRSKRTNKPCCEKCFKSAPRCASCAGPMKKGEGTSVRGEIICDYCAKHQPKCTSCGKPIVKRAVSYKFADGLFCEHCVKTKPHCHICAVPIGGTHTVLADGRRLCPACKKTAVFSQEMLRVIHGRVKSFLKTKLAMEIQHEYELKMVRTRKELGGLDGEIEGKELGLFRCIQGTFSILILDGATEAMCHETLAHEVAHAWHAERGMEFADDEIKEGFAQWVASKALEHFEYKKALARLRARTDPHYGTGYQKLWAIEKKGGADAVFDHVRKNSQRKRK